MFLLQEFGDAGASKLSHVSTGILELQGRTEQVGVKAL